MAEWFSANAAEAGKHSTILTVLFFILAVGAGIIAETIGARFEYHICDRAGKRNHENFSAVWNKYLTLKFEHDPIGQTYLKYLHLHLKFELNFSVAVLMFACAVGTMHFQHADWTVDWPFYVSCLVVAAALLWESVASSNNLHTVRKQLVDKYQPLTRQ